MRVAVVSQLTSPGGGARFMRGLCLGLLEQPEIEELALFVPATDANRDGILTLAPESARFTVHLLTPDGRLIGEGGADTPARRRSLRDWARDQRWLVRAYRWAFRLDRVDRMREEAREAVSPDEPSDSLPVVRLSADVEAAIAQYDLAYFPWPRQVHPPARPDALVATFHDFNHRHGFGNFRPQDVELLDAELREWLTGRVQPVSSTPFIAAELDEYFPERTHEPQVVYLSTFAIHQPEEAEVAQVRDRLGLPERYLLCPTNIGPHKNLVSLLKAAGRMKRAGVLAPIVLTGSGTQCLGVDPTGDPLYSFVFVEPIDLLNETIVAEGLIPGEDFFALGYVSDEEMDALVKGATLVVAPSRYEAGSGPALDAWWLGTPVASSSLVPVVQQIGFLGTEAVLFDPLDIAGMADALASALARPEELRAMAERSRDAIRRYTWNEVARGYVGVFERAIAASRELDDLAALVATRLRDRRLRDPGQMREYCLLDAGFAEDYTTVHPPGASLRARLRAVPVLGPVLFGAYRLLRGRRAAE